MTSRYLTVLGTASRISTRTRAVGGYALHWDDQLILFDPGEGFQRQCLLAGVAIGRATAVCITHFHGDHCLGLPGIIHRRALSGCKELLPVYFPAEGRPHFEHLVNTSVYEGEFVDPNPVDRCGVVGAIGSLSLISQPLEHRIPTVGYRVQEPDRTGLRAESLRDLALQGPAVGQLLRTGSLEVEDHLVATEELSEARPGQAAAFVMDTIRCGGAMELASGVDLLVCEATFLERDRALAQAGKHMTARQAAMLARQAGTQRLVLSHFSSRYLETAGHLQEASRIHDDVVVAQDLGVIDVPTRRPLQRS